MGQKSKFLVKHGLAVNTQSGTTTTLNYPTADGANQQYLRTDGQGNLQFDSPGGGGGGGTFLSLGDTPASYAGAPGRVLVVNDSGNGLTLSASPLNNSQSRFEFTGDGSTVNFVTGTTQFTTVDHILVYVDGVIQAPTTNFTLDSTVITFTSAPANNADILVFGTVTASGFPQGLIDSDALTNPLGLRGRLNAGGHIVPKVDSAYDLGDSALKWRDLYMSGSTIHIGGVTIKSDGQGVVLPANSKIGNRRFKGSGDDSAEKGFDSDLKGTYGSTTAIPILKIDSAGFIDSVGTASITSDLLGDTSPQLGGNLDVNSKAIIFGDADSSGPLPNRLIMGADSDLQIYHDGKNSYIDNTKVGDLILRNNLPDTYTGRIRLQPRNGEDGIEVMADDGVRLYANGSVSQYVTASNISLYQPLHIHKLGGYIQFEGDSTNSFETKIIPTNPTADRTITLPDETGTVLLQNSTTGLIDISASTAGRNYLRNSGTFNYLVMQNSTSGTGTDDGTIVGVTQAGNALLAQRASNGGTIDFLTTDSSGSYGIRSRFGSKALFLTDVEIDPDKSLVLKPSQYGTQSIKFERDLYIRDSNSTNTNNTDVFIRSQRDQDRGPIHFNLWKDIPSPDSGDQVAMMIHTGTDDVGSGLQAPYSRQFTEIRDYNTNQNADSARGRYGRYEFNLPLNGVKFRKYDTNNHQYSVDWQSAEAKKIGNVGHAWTTNGSIPLRMDWNKVNVPHALNVGMDSSLNPTERFVVQGVDTRRLTFGDSCLTVTTSTATSNINDANVARFRKTTEPVGLDVMVYKDGTGYSSGVATNINETAAGGVSLQDNTYIGLMYWQDNRTANKSHNFASLDTNGSTYRTMLSMKGDSTMEATFGGKVILPAAGVQFSDGTSQTTAASGGGGVTTGKAIAMAMIFG